MVIVEEIIEGSEDVLKTVEELKKDGNQHFGEGDWSGAAEKYEEALRLCPEEASTQKSLLLSNLAAAFIKQEEWQKAAENASRAIELGVPNEKALERRAFAYSNLSEKYESSIEDYEQILTLYPNRTYIRQKIDNVRKKIDQRNEELKTDVLQKLKGLGDFCLKPFGLSTDSFELKPNSEGGYSIQMRDRPNTQEENQSSA
ncbi:unnamed protein product [Caenorhabditis auriculariae]|uniref:Uncharacterized protein n=1 Tax=Caenorhabditis auriculariae TaxID=2777116 RepID=A0A8S1GNR3_9PELO|nr:unnamed protein product [Caenorhabditis auriculariae]